MKIVIPNVFINFAKIKYEGKNIYAFENIPPFTYNTPYPNYVLYEEQEDNFVPVFQDFTPYDIDMEIMLSQIASGNIHIKVPKFSQTIEEPEKITKYFSKQIEEIIYNVYNYLKLVQSKIDASWVTFKLLSAYLFEDEILFYPKINREIHKNFKEATRIEAICPGMNIEWMKQMLKALGVLETTDCFGHATTYLPSPLFDFKKIEKDFSFSKKDLKEFLNQNSESLFEDTSITYEDENVKIEKIVHKNIGKNKKATLTTKYELYKKDIIPSSKEILSSDLIYKAFYSPYTEEHATAPGYGEIIKDEENLYKISFTTEIPDNSQIYKTLFKLILHTKEEIKVFPFRKHVVTQNEKNLYTIEYNNAINKIQTTLYIPENFMKDLNLSLSLKIIDTICNY